MTLNQKSTATSGQSVIAVHGSASTGRQWKRLANLLQPTLSVSTPDLPGYGNASNSASALPPTLSDDGSVIVNLTATTQSPVHFVAHSYGAAVALRFALDNPERVKSLVLIEPALFHVLRNGGPRELSSFFEICAVSDAVRTAVSAGRPERGMAAFVDYWNGSGAWSAMPPSLQAALAPQATQVIRNFSAALSETWSAGACRRIQCPTVLIAGDHTQAPALRVSEIISDAIPQSQLRILPGLSHMAPVTHPDVINPLIAEALEAATTGSIEASFPEAA